MLNILLDSSLQHSAYTSTVNLTFRVFWSKHISSANVLQNAIRFWFLRQQFDIWPNPWICYIMIRLEVSERYVNNFVQNLVYAPIQFAINDVEKILLNYHNYKQITSLVYLHISLKLPLFKIFLFFTHQLVLCWSIIINNIDLWLLLRLI